MITTQLIRAFVSATYIVPSLYFLNPKFVVQPYRVVPTSSQFVYDQEDGFSHDEAHIG